MKVEEDQNTGLSIGSARSDNEDQSQQLTVKYLKNNSERLKLCIWIVILLGVLIALFILAKLQSQSNRKIEQKFQDLSLAINKKYNDLNKIQKNLTFILGQIKSLQLVSGVNQSQTKKKTYKRQNLIRKNIENQNKNQSYKNKNQSYKNLTSQMNQTKNQNFISTANQSRTQTDTIKRQNFIKKNEEYLRKIKYKYNISRLDNPHMDVIDVKYSSKKYSKMPLNPTQKNQKGQKVEQFLYNDQDRRSRYEFLKKRNLFIKSQIHRKGLQQYRLAQFTIPQNQQAFRQGVQMNRQQWLRLQKKFNLSKIQSQLFFCFIVTGSNNNAQYRIEFNLNSLFMLNYTNYKAVIIDDFSTDGSIQIYKKYLEFHHLYQIIPQYKKIISDQKLISLGLCKQVIIFMQKLENIKQRLQTKQSGKKN